MTSQDKIIQISTHFSDEDLIAICEAADVIACECPVYLVQLLREVRKFRRYTNDCIEQFPSDVATHNWLCSRAAQIELLLSQTIVEFLHKEKLIDERNNQLSLNELSERSRKLVLSQI